jgi:glycosyltransferase involved in cell wall biosynthesis
MDGLYYFSVVEEYVAKGVQYPYPVPKSFLDFSLIEPSETDHDPTGIDYDEFKFWFEVNAVSSSLISARFQNLVGSSNMFHRENHWLYHRKLSSTSDLGLNMIGWHGGIFGLGIQASKLYLAAQASGLWANAVPLKPMLLSDSGPKYLHPNNMKYNLTRSCSEATNVVFVNADHTRNAQHVIPELIWRFKYTIGYFEWELDVFPQKWISLMQEYDEVWVSTTFIAHSIMNTPGYPKIPIKVVPIPLAFHDSGPSKLTDIEDPSGLLYEVMKDISEEAFVFLVVFDFWSCAERKNPEAAIRSFLEAFPLESDIENRHHLIIKSQNGTPIQLEILQNKTLDDPRIHLLSYLITPAELNELQSRADCYVSLHRSEGFGMNILEEMGNGVPVIATNYSGNVDFFPAVQDYIGKCIFPVPYILIEINETIGGYEAGNHWAEPDHDFAVESMRIVAKNDCKKKHGEKISHQVMQNFGMDAVGRMMKQALVESFDRIQRKQESFLENRRRMI